MKMSETTLFIKMLLLKGSKPNSHLRSTRCIFKSHCSIELIFSKICTVASARDSRVERKKKFRNPLINEFFEASGLK